MKQAKSISASVGENLREWREEAGLTQNEVAKTAGELGFEWRQSTVAAIESGRRELSLGEFIALPFIVNLLDPKPSPSRGRFRRLGGFIGGGEEDVALAPDAWFHDPQNNLSELLRGSPVGGQGKVPAGALKPRPGVEEQIRPRVEAVLEAEQKASRSLGVDGMAVRAASYQLWGRSLTDERESRVGRRADSDVSARSLQAVRGHVTRELLAELAEVIKEPSSRKQKKKGRR